MTLHEAITALLDEFHIADYIYDVRSKIVDDRAYQGNTWNHPKVLRFNEAVMTLQKFKKEGETP